MCIYIYHLICIYTHTHAYPFWVHPKQDGLATSVEAPALDMGFPLALHIFAAGPHAALSEEGSITRHATVSKKPD